MIGKEIEFEWGTYETMKGVVLDKIIQPTVFSCGHGYSSSSKVVTQTFYLVKIYESYRDKEGIKIVCPTNIVNVRTKKKPKSFE